MEDLWGALTDKANTTTLTKSGDRFYYLTEVHLAVLIVIYCRIISVSTGLYPDLDCKVCNWGYEL